MDSLQSIAVELNSKLRLIYHMCIYT